MKFLKIIFLVLLVSLLLVACGGETPPESVVAEPTTAVSETTTTTESTAFPVTIEHKFGSTTIPAEPERVVSIGFTDQDYLLALGVVPVGIRDWFGEQPNAVWPWARHLLNGAEPEVLPREMNFEQIAELQPDLIVAIYTSLTENEYEFLSAIAPTVTQPPDMGDYEITWQEQTRYTGQIVGQSERAEELVTRLEEKIAQARTDHPEFEGSEYGFASAYAGDHYLYGERSTASRFLTSLGFEVPEDILEITDNDSDYFVFSAERMQVVDRPLTLWSEGRTNENIVALLDNPLYAELPVHTEGRDIFLGLDLYGGAFSFSSILSLDMLVDDLVPAMVLALDGDPATIPTLGQADAEVAVEEETTEESTDATFPVTIEHAFGETTIEATPERIVSIGYADQDPLIALGAPMIAGRYWFGDTESVVFPWAADDLQGEEPEVLNMAFGALNFETILSLDPDLIIAVSSGIMEDEYELLSEIAPTIAQGGEYDNFGMPWHEATQSIGDAVGKSAEAEALIADVQSVFSDAAAAHPEFAGKEIVVGGIRSDGGDYFFFSAQDARTRFFTDLGFIAPADLDELTGESFYTDISSEQVELLDRDFIVFSQASYLPEGADTILNDPLLAQLDAIKEGRFIILSEEIDGAFSVSSVLSLPYAVEELVPQLADALAQ